MKKVILYCDGSSLGNPGFGGWCTIIKYKTTQNIISGAEANTTNNRMELTAVIEALKKLKEPCEIEIVSDSKYVCDGIGKWITNWQKKNFKNVKNPDLWKEYLTLATNHIIKTSWVKGHNGHPENEQCDCIAKKEASELKEKIITNDAQDKTTVTHNKLAQDSILDMAKKSDSKFKIDSRLTTSEVQDSLHMLQKIIKYRFNDRNLLIQSLTHRSFNKHYNNERLEFLGDAVLDLLVGEYVFKKLESSNEGDLTKLRASMVNESSFAKLANALKLGDYLFISDSEVKNNGRAKPSILSDAFEALIGAIYLDSGIESARVLIYKLLEKVFVDIDLENLFKDYKTSLQELTQAICGVIPEYLLIDSSGPDHNKNFVMSVKINGIEYASASGKSKKEAEQNCAKIAYASFKMEKK